MNLTDEQRACSFKSSDVDLFLYGLTPEEGAAKIEEIYYAVQAATNGACEVCYPFQ